MIVTGSSCPSITRSISGTRRRCSGPPRASPGPRSAGQASRRPSPRTVRQGPGASAGRPRSKARPARRPCRAALGMMDLLVRRGVRNPEDISIVCNDDSEIAGRHYVDLTSVAQDTRRLAEEAVALAERRMAPASAQADPDGQDPRGRTVPVELIVRGTTAAPRAGGRPPWVLS